ncbi:zf-HC2 domain-containing protein [Streptosporangiaceae bacterium NEAU-GS5]|nr:zf-HC2 domain-containing protein [Streptosporangiaceae bacterium NEAU-GS5]
MRLSLGVYVLGAVDHEEATRVEAHLDRCPECAAELAELSGLPPLLGRVSAEDVAVASRPPAVVLDRLLTSTAQRQRRSRFLLTAAASVVAITLAGSMWMVSGHSSELVSAGAAPPSAQKRTTQDSSATLAQDTQPVQLPTPAPSRTTRPLEVRGKHGGVVLELALTPGSGGTVVGIEVSGVPEGTSCSLIAVDRVGAVSPIASWRVTAVDYHDGRAHFPPGSTEFSLEEIQRFELLTSGGQRLVTIRL